MAKSIEDRKKSGPLSPTWTSIKGKHKALGAGLFKPDITPLINAYDQGLVNYDKLLDAKKKLYDLLTAGAKASSANEAERKQHLAELDKVNAKDNDVLAKSGTELKAFD